MKERELIRRYFRKLGFEREMADIYTALYQHGPQTISELARNSGVERTRIYRSMGELEKSGLIEIETEYKRDILRAAPLSNIEIVLSKKEQELRGLRSEFTRLEDMLTSDNLGTAGTRVQFYRGLEGVKQMYWNDTKAETEVLAIMNENMQLRTKSAFFERWVHKRNERKIASRGLINDVFIASQQKWYGKKSNERLKLWQARYVPDDVFRISHWTVVYNDVVAYHGWRAGEIFGVEIYNQQIADTQRQFFEILWRQAMPVNDVTGDKIDGE